MMRWLRWGFFLSLVWRFFAPVVTPRFGPGQRHPWKVPARSVFVGEQEFLFRRVGPEDGPDLVLIHGLGGSSLVEWYEIGQRLQEGFRLTLIDHRSHGLAPRFTGRYDVADVADDIAEVMAAAGVDDADVVGYSMGGTIAQELAHRHPQRVRRLVLIGTFASHPRGMRWFRIAFATLTRGWERFTGLGTPEVRTGYLAAIGAIKPEHVRYFWEESHRRDLEAGAAASYALFRFDSTGWIGTLTQRTLVIIPTADQLVPPAWQYALAAAITDVEVVELADARHEVVWTHPDRIASAIRDFLS